MQATGSAGGRIAIVAQTRYVHRQSRWLQCNTRKNTSSSHRLPILNLPFH